MNLAELTSIDLKKIPTEILQQMYLSMLQELQHRRAVVKVDSCRLAEFNGELLKRMPNESHVYNRHHLKYLDELIGQDWSGMFTGGSNEKRYYVYAHVAPSGKRVKHDGALKIELPGLPFYIGKGTGDRAYDLKRNQGHGIEIKQLIARGNSASDIVQIIKDGMTENEAYELESKLIYFFGTRFEKHRRGLLVNLDRPPTPFI